ncbi:MAG: 16S rRNA (cytosine(967)-C(5))-methyltransferase RsmB [Clostridia bacterium]|nr:16S rRNA (cytosine(967)-C(5))-methyltransferase RsmB [Clostridia bacterium]
MSNVRETALQILNKCDLAGQFSNLALDTALKRNALSSADRGLLTALVYGTIERRMTLDHWIASLSSRPMEDVDESTKNLLRMGLYQLAYLDRVPDHAAVHETVSLAPKRTKGFVNAILRAFLRAKKQIAWPTDPLERLSVQYSFSQKICEEFVAAFGYARTEALLAAFGKQPPLTLRVNTLRTSRESFLSVLKEAGYAARATAESQTGVLLDGAPIASIPGFAEGNFFVQDEASQLCVEALQAQKGMTLIDVCACPGSKSFGAAINMENEGRVYACDLHKNKLSLVTGGAERLGISIVETFPRDARTVEERWIGQADRVLCDVPCSGFGVFAKKPELRYKDPAQSRALPDIQLAIAESACQYVRVGGRLVYSTCTLLPRENGENVRRFLERHPEFLLLRERTLYPDTDGTDGFYFAVLEKRTLSNI